MPSGAGLTSPVRRHSASIWKIVRRGIPLRCDIDFASRLQEVCIWMMTALRSSENAIPAAISNEWWAKGWAGWVSKKSFHMILPSPVLPTSNIQLVGCIACKPFRNISKLSRRDHSRMSPTMVVSRPASDSLSFKSGVASSVSDHGGIRGLCFSVCCA